MNLFRVLTFTVLVGFSFQASAYVDPVSGNDFPTLVCSGFTGGNLEQPCYDKYINWAGYYCVATVDNYWCFGSPLIPDCPENYTWNNESWSCQADPIECEYGSLAPDCAVYCPPLQYTYTIDGVAYRGSISGGTVGYGQTCPTPSYPPGSNGGCVGSPGTCGDYGDALNEGTESSTTTEETSADGETTTKTTSTSDSGSGGFTSVSGSGSPDGSVTDSNGGELSETDEFGEPNYTDTVDIGDSTVGRCAHGGLVGGNGNCDYPPHSCGPNQYDTEYGCVEKPPENNEPPPQGDTVTTETVTNPDGSTTTTTHTTSGGNGGTGDGGETTEEAFRSGAASDNCLERPDCSGDPINCAILVQVWMQQCQGESSVGDPLDCVSEFVCEGDFIECASLTLDHEKACGLKNAESHAEGYYTDQSMASLDDYTEGQLFQDLGGDTETDLQSDLGAFFNVASSSGSCPPPQSVNLGQWGTHHFEYTLFCDLASAIRAIVLLAATMVGGTIVLRSASN